MRTCTRNGRWALNALPPSTLRCESKSTPSPLSLIFFRENRHDDRVLELAELEPVIAQHSFAAEAAFLVARNRSLIEFEYVQMHAMQTHLLKSETQQDLHRVSAVATSPVALVANDHSQPAMP